MTTTRAADDEDQQRYQLATATTDTMFQLATTDEEMTRHG